MLSAFAVPGFESSMAHDGRGSLEGTLTGGWVLVQWLLTVVVCVGRNFSAIFVFRVDRFGAIVEWSSGTLTATGKGGNVTC